MNIRSATTEDLEYFLRHGVALRDLEMSFGFHGYLGDDREFVREYSRYLVLATQRGDYYLYVAEVDGKVIGTLIGCIEPTESFYRDHFVGVIRFIYIDPQEREQSVAKALVEEFEEEMRKTGVGAVFATINQWNSLPQFKLLHHGWQYGHVQLYREL